MFAIDGQRYGVSLDATERVVPAVAVTPLPKGPAIVLGVIDLQGRIVPVVDTRRRFGRSGRDILPSDQLIVTRAAGRTVALVADETAGVLEVDTAELVSATEFLPAQPYVRGVVRLPDGLILIHDVNTFLALDEAAALDDALRDREGVPS